MEFLFPKQIAKRDKETFYQSKYEYYGRIGHFAAIMMGIAEIIYFFTDCQIFGKIKLDTLLPRLSVLIPLILYILVHKKRKDYKINMIFAYLVAHGSMWATIWAVYFLENKDFAREGFIIMHFGFMIIGLCYPVKYSGPIHSLMLLNIAISNQFIHYEAYTMMITLAIPLYFSIVLMEKVVENSFVQQYNAQKKLAELSTIDQLTQVYNRNKLDSIVEPGTEAFAFDDVENIVMLILDIDYFKKINDTYGHEDGDKVLVFVTEQIKRQIRSDDMIIRWGGEEFVIILKNLSPEVGKRIAERIRQSIEKADNQVSPITVSIGVAVYDKHSYRETFKEADKALYNAKRKGRNKVCCSF